MEEFFFSPIPLLAVPLLICHCSKLYWNPKEKGTSLQVPAHMLKDTFRCTSFGVTSCFIFYFSFCGEKVDVTLQVELENVKWNEAFGLGLPQLTGGVRQKPGRLWHSVPGEQAFPQQAFVPQKTLWWDEDVCCLLLRWQLREGVGGPSA